MSQSTNNTQIDELINHLVKYELAIAGLYETFASILPESKKDWTALANEERLHAKWINTLHTHLKNEKLTFEQTKFTAQAAKTAINYVEDQIDKAKKTKPDLKNSLNTAINIEKSLLESAFFRVFNLRGLETKKVRSQLEEATRSHIDRLIEWRENIKPSQK
jgi:hypothetical protein